MQEATSTDLQEIERPKRALVLSGGGARGAYQVGVLKALFSMDIKFDVMFGTSVGGINTAFVAQNKFDRLEEIWRNIKPTDVFRFPSLGKLREVLIENRLGFLGGLLDTTPLEELLDREMDVNQLKANKAKVGFVTTNLCTLETRLVTGDDIESRRQLVDILMASAALPILFPARTLNGDGFWIDGGLVRNTPMQAAINMGAKDIYVVIVQAENDGTCPTNIMQVISRCADILLYASARDGIRLVNQYNKVIETQSPESAAGHKVSVKVFQPRNEVNYTVLDINAQRSRELIRQGYDESMYMLTALTAQEQMFGVT